MLLYDVHVRVEVVLHVELGTFAARVGDVDEGWHDHAGQGVLLSFVFLTTLLPARCSGYSKICTVSGILRPTSYVTLMWRTPLIEPLP